MKNKFLIRVPIDNIFPNKPNKNYYVSYFPIKKLDCKE